MRLIFPAIRKRVIVTHLSALALALLLVSTGQAQGTAALLSRVNPPNPAMGWGGRFLNSGMPGVANPASPMVHPPTFRGEARFRPISLSIEGSLRDTTTGAFLDLNADIGLKKHVILVESMMRTQFSRLGFRFHTDTYVSKFEGSHVKLDWPTYRVGLDYEILERSSFKIGLNADACTEAPRLEVTHPLISVGAVSFPIPATWGIHLVVNPFDLGGLMTSLEARGRRSLRTGTRLDELDVSAGFKTPATLMGAFGLRGGWRYTAVEADANNLTFTSKWSGFFADIVLMY